MKLNPVKRYTQLLMDGHSSPSAIRQLAREIRNEALEEAAKVVASNGMHSTDARDIRNLTNEQIVRRWDDGKGMYIFAVRARQKSRKYAKAK